MQRAEIRRTEADGLCSGSRRAALSSWVGLPVPPSLQHAYCATVVKNKRQLKVVDAFQIAWKSLIKIPPPKALLL